MKKTLVQISILCFLMPAVFADDWDDFSGLDKAWDGQKSITNQEFEDAINTLEANQKKKEEKQKKKKIKKISGGGTSLHPDLAPGGEIPTLKQASKNEDGMLLNVPVNMLIDGNILDKGFYNIYAEKDKNKNIYISFYQSQFLKGKVRAFETTDDYDSESIDFVKYEPYGNDHIKIIFGSLDFNAYTFVKISE